MTTHRPEADASRIVTFADKLFIPLLGLLGAPIRAFYLGVGQAQVASYGLIAIAIVAVGYLWTDSQHQLNEPLVTARVSQVEAQLRMEELRIREKEEALGVESTTLVWRLGELDYDAEANTVSIEFVPLPTVEKILFGWREYGGDGGGGVEVGGIVVDTAGVGRSTFDMSGEWIPNRRYTTWFEQEDAEGHRTRWQQSGRVLEVPPASGP